MNKWQKWHSGLSAHTLAYLKTQALWHDQHLCVAFVAGMAVGIIIGVAA